MKGYLNQPEATAATLDSDGWLHTGDVAIIDEDHHMTIVDRVKELIKYNGFRFRLRNLRLSSSRTQK